MGCLWEMFFEILVEGVFELIGYGCIKLICRLVPNKTISDRTKRIIKYIVMSTVALWAIVLIIGLILLMQNDPSIRNIGKNMTCILLSVIVLQIIFGIIIKMISHVKK